MTALIRLRKECPEIGLGDWKIINLKNKPVLCLCYFWKGCTVLTLHNLSDKPLEVLLPAAAGDGGVLNDLMKLDEVTLNEKQVYTIALDSFGYRWFRVKG
jgi:maltose alpha-D-glucosyltransferase/alpha-amylase